MIDYCLRGQHGDLCATRYLQVHRCVLDRMQNNFLTLQDTSWYLFYRTTTKQDLDFPLDKNTREPHLDKNTRERDLDKTTTERDVDLTTQRRFSL
jgi:hypothetical protein